MPGAGPETAGRVVDGPAAGGRAVPAGLAAAVEGAPGHVILARSGEVPSAAARSSSKLGRSRTGVGSPGGSTDTESLVQVEAPCTNPTVTPRRVSRPHAVTSAPAPRSRSSPVHVSGPSSRSGDTVTTGDG